MNLSGASSVGIAVAAGAVVLFTAIFAALRGYGGDPVERLAGWARTRGLAYVPVPTPGSLPEVGQGPASGRVNVSGDGPVPGRQMLATFAGEIEGRHVEVVVTRVARGLGSDLPPRLTTVMAGSAGGDVACVLQPATWVMDRNGRDAGEPVPTGDASFDERWSARGDADAVARLVTPMLRERLLAADADGLVIELLPRAVAIPIPGVCADPRELDRRMALALSLCPTPPA